MTNQVLSVLSIFRFVNHTNCVIPTSVTPPNSSKSKTPDQHETRPKFSQSTITDLGNDHRCLRSSSNCRGLHGESAAEAAAICADKQVHELVQEAEAVRRNEARALHGRRAERAVRPANALRSERERSATGHTTQIHADKRRCTKGSCFW